MKHIRSSWIVAVLCALMALLVVSCRKEPSAKGGSLLDADYLRRLPAGVFAFLTFDLEGRAYEEFLGTPWGKQKSRFLENLKGSGASGPVRALEPIIEAFEKAGLVGAESGKPAAVRGGVLFMSADPSGKSPSGVGIHLAGKANVDLKEKLQTLRGALADAGVSLKDEDFGGIKGLSLTVESLTAEAGDSAVAGLPLSAPRSFSIAASSSDIVAASSPALLQAVLSSASQNGIEKIRQDSLFQKTYRSVPPSKLAFAYGYIDFARLLSSPEAKLLAAAGDMVAQQLPIEAAVFQRSMDDGLSDRMAFLVAPKSDEQKALFSKLQTGVKTDLVALLPGSSVLALALDGVLLKGIKDSALAGMGAGGQPKLASSLKLLDAVEGVALGLRGGAPFPEAMVVAGSAKSAEVMAEVQTQIGSAGAGALPLSAWQEKQISGTSVRYMQTPLGIGVYMAALKDKAVVASTDSALSDTLAAISGQGSLGGKLSGQPGALLTKRPNPFLVIYADFKLMASAIESLHASLGMFTGGKAFVPAEQIEALRQMGSALMAARAEGDAVTVDARYFSVQ